MQMTTIFLIRKRGGRVAALIGIFATVVVSSVLQTSAEEISSVQEPKDEAGFSIKQSESTKETRLPTDLLQRVTVHRKEYLRNGHAVVMFEVENHVMMNSEGEEKWIGEGKSFVLTSPSGVRVTINPSTGQIGRAVAVMPFYIDVIASTDEDEPTQVWFAVPQDDVYEKLELWRNGDVELATGDRYQLEKKLMAETAQALLEAMAVPESE